MIVCGGLDDARNRYPRENGTACECPEGWEGINCNGKVNDYEIISRFLCQFLNIFFCL